MPLWDLCLDRATIVELHNRPLGGSMQSIKHLGVNIWLRMEVKYSILAVSKAVTAFCKPKNKKADRKWLKVLSFCVANWFQRIKVHHAGDLQIAWKTESTSVNICYRTVCRGHWTNCSVLETFIR